MKIITLKTPLIFSFKECLKSLGRSYNECLFSIENGKVRKLFILNETPILIEFFLENENNLKLQFLNVNPPDSQVLFIKSYIENWLDLNYDLYHFYMMAKRDKLLNPLIKNYHGLRLIGIPDFFEAICWAIIGQQINLNFAYSVKRNLVECFGFKYQFEGKNYYHFPEPEKILSISDEEFIKLKFSRQKTAYIRAVSKRIIEKSFDSELLKKMKYDAAKKELISLHGIGNWSADYVLMKTFRHPQAFPFKDAGLLNALKKQLGLPQKPDFETILKVSKPWKGFEAYATFYLWRSLYD